MALAVQAEVDERKLRESLARLCLRGDTDHVLALMEELPQRGTAPLDPDGNTALHHAVRSGHLRLTQELLGRGAEVNARDLKQWTPLHVACLEEHADLAAELLAAKADPNAGDEVQQTPMHLTMKGTNVELLRVLIELGRADPALADLSKTTPLLLAAEYGKFELLDFLLSKDPGLASQQNESGWTALHLAAHGREMRRNSMKPAKFGSSVKILLQAKAAVDKVDDDEKTALHRAAATGNSETTIALLEGGANVMAADNCRWTPLHYACHEGHLEVARHLIERGAQVQRDPPPCLTPLAVATMENQVKIAELLMKHQADPNLRGKGLASPMMIARKEPEKHGDLLALFELGLTTSASYMAHTDRKSR